MQRVGELDGLRGLAALVVVVYHIGLLERRFTISFGWAMVDLFFVLSGYLITRILLQHRPTLDFFAAFYARRALRIWPIYYLVIAALVVANPYLPLPQPLDRLLNYLSFTQGSEFYTSSMKIKSHRCLDHTWTLALEEQFYLIWPLLVFLLGRKRLIPFTLVLVSGSLGARLAGFVPCTLLARCDGLALGGMLAALMTEREDSPVRLEALRRAFLGMAPLVLSLLAGVVLLRGRGSTGSYRDALLITAFNLTFFVAIGLVLCHAGGRLCAPLRDSRLRAFGTISYGLYFYHGPILILTYDFAQAMGLGYPALLPFGMLGLAILVATVSWLTIERPLLSMKKWLPYDGESASAPVPAASPS